MDVFSPLREAPTLLPRNDNIVIGLSLIIDMEALRRLTGTGLAMVL
jgi:hypothetical protein